MPSINCDGAVNFDPKEIVRWVKDGRTSGFILFKPFESVLNMVSFFTFGNRRRSQLLNVSITNSLTNDPYNLTR